jgi:hypothetical protein
MNVEASAPFEASFAAGQAGLTPEVAVIDQDGAVVIGPTAANIAEEIVGGNPIGIYSWNAPAAPATPGQYAIVWSPDGLWDPDTVSTPDELVVFAAGATVEPAPIPAPGGGGMPFGPATAWTTADDVAACCSVEVGSDTSVFDSAVDEASQLLFALSARQFLGLAQKIVRPPCRNGCGCGQVLSRGHVVESGWPLWGWYWHREGACWPSQVALPGYPLREITEVKIDGVAIDPAGYRLDDRRYLTRLNNLIWPRCQNLTLPDTEDGTWSVTYTYGQEPPLIGQAAARQLACELYKACNEQECALPAGTTRVVRQGVVIERLAFTAWGLQDRIWRTGLTLVDAFLNAHNPHRLMSRPAIWSPASHLQYARTVGS